jgi:predicted permease
MPFWRRRRREAELDEEIRAHLAMSARDHEARGESATEAAYAARREFGNATLVKEVARQVWGGAWLDRLVRDLRFALRSLARSPGFLIVTVLALALGLGLSATMFSVIDAALHPPQPYANKDRLFALSYRSGRPPSGGLPEAAFLQMVRERVPAFDAVMPRGGRMDPIQLGSEQQFQLEYVVPARFFDVTGLHPELGRTFVPSDGPNVAVVSHDVWRAALGGRRNLAGAHLILGDRSYAVIGVVPSGVRVAGVFMPLMPSDEAAGQIQDAEASSPVVRLGAGVPLSEAVSQTKALARLLTATYGSPAAPWAVELTPWTEWNPVPDEAKTIRLLMVAAALAVLLIACVNLGHLMLARGLARRRELAIRMALGSGRSGALRLMLSETFVIAAVGLALGALLAVWGSKVVEAMVPLEMLMLGLFRARVSWRVFGLAGLTAVIAATVFGILPALRVAFSVHLTEPLKDEGGTTTGGARWRYNPLVIFEVALTLTIVMCGTVVLRTLHHVRSDLATFEFQTLENVEVMRSAPLRPDHGPDTSKAIDPNQILATVHSLPGVLGAALISNGKALGAAVTAELGPDSTRMLTMQSYPIVSPDYLGVHGLTILQGRDFEPGDVTGTGVAILSEAAAARLYPRGPAVGRMLKLGGPTTRAPWVRIVGVGSTPVAPWTRSGFVSGSGTDEDSPPVWVAAPIGRGSPARLLVRVTRDDPAVLMRLNRALRAAAPGASVSVRPYTWIRDSVTGYLAFMGRVFTAVGALGLGLAALGLFGTQAYAVSRRMREFGVRVALGAEPRVLFRMVMHDGLVMLLAGTGIGAFGAVAAAPLFAKVALEFNSADVASLVGAEAVLLVVGVAASLAPAFRAVRANPLNIIRAV